MYSINIIQYMLYCVIACGFAGDILYYIIRITHILIWGGGGVNYVIARIFIKKTNSRFSVHEHESMTRHAKLNRYHNINYKIHQLEHPTSS